MFFADLGGNLYALDSSTGQKLWVGPLGTGSGIGGGVITYAVDGVQKVAVADGFTMVVANEAKAGKSRHLGPR
ncbi:PQQ enzyme repeat-containing protein [Variovorax sp. HW608]|uniref:PQQ-binding-like beta-propeller repeat protein n=1 Tax=Variovorax sp. HW608 TaxID=1034889 RepID=UPI00081FC9D3|nr:PQQ-binding-like beta-propeller repeat protein [Variovorax sp. HW608]SCK27448.1 PQQ enzyme repeat-containing protein [Variovorax sp. HW608]